MTFLLKDNNRLFGVILLALLCLHLAVAWPGILSPDSIGQYAMAKSGVYSDHHPALMSFVWRYLDRILEGSGLMLALHLVMLYTGLWYFIRAVSARTVNHARWLCLALALIPFFPGVLVYSLMIWKDVGFAYAYLLCAGLLTHAWVTQKRLSLLKSVLFFAVLLYGSAVKFQGQYIAPWMLLWWSITSVVSWKAKAIRFVTSVCVFYAALFGVQKTLVPNAQQNHSWQYVKLYDLAALSVYKHTPLIPEFTKKFNYTDEQLFTLFNHNSVDSLVYGEQAILRMGITESERDEILSIWRREVIKLPHVYLIHRIKNLAYALLSTPGYQEILGALGDTYKNPLVKLSARTFGYLFLAHALYALLTLIYMVLGVRFWSSSLWAAPLVFINMCSLTMMGVLLIFSMAGTPRYTYIMMCLCQVSHVMAYAVWRDKSMTTGS